MTVTKILLRRGTTTEWVANDIVLDFGEPAVERKTDGTIIMKIGDGIRPWSELPVIGGEGKTGGGDNCDCDTSKGGGYEYIPSDKFRLEELVESERIDLREGMRIRANSIWASANAWSPWSSLRTRIPENALRATQNVYLHSNSSGSSGNGSSSDTPYGKLQGSIHDRGLMLNNKGEQTKVFVFTMAVEDTHAGSGFGLGRTWNVEISISGYPQGDWSNDDTSSTYIRIRPASVSTWYSDVTFTFMGNATIDGVEKITGQRLVPIDFELNGLYRLRVEKKIEFVQLNSGHGSKNDFDNFLAIRSEAFVSNEVPSGGGLINVDYFDSWNNDIVVQPAGVMDVEIKGNAFLIRSNDFMRPSYGDEILLLITKWQVEKIGGNA